MNDIQVSVIPAQRKPPNQADRLKTRQYDIEVTIEPARSQEMATTELLRTTTERLKKEFAPFDVFNARLRACNLDLNEKIECSCFEKTEHCKNCCK